MLAPVIAMSVALVTFIVVPFGDQLRIPVGDGATFDVMLKVSDIDAGLLFVLAMTSIGVYGVMLAGWASNNKFSLLGGLRASAQMVSYELAMGLSAVVVFLIAGSVSLSDIAESQSGAIWNWTVFTPVGFLAFVLFWTSAFAETNRTPFDLPEGEAELVAGYHTEYSSLRFALFFMAEYANMIVASAVTATLFFGGYNVPFLTGETIRANADLLVTLAGFGAVPAFVLFAYIAYNRRRRPFYAALRADDIRHREPLFFTAVWSGAAVAHAGLGVLGLTGVLGGTILGPEVVAFVFQLTALTVKVLFGCWFFIWVRWTVPRFRYDQLMNLGWKVLIPLSLGWFIVLASIQVGSDAGWNQVVVVAASLGVLVLGALLLLAAVRVSARNREREGSVF
jgi:NADH-quinone oxidoreductase subunit H